MHCTRDGASGDSRYIVTVGDAKKAGMQAVLEYLYSDSVKGLCGVSGGREVWEGEGEREEGREGGAGRAGGGERGSEVWGQVLALSDRFDLPRLRALVLAGGYSLSLEREREPGRQTHTQAGRQAGRQTETLSCNEGIMHGA